MNRVAQISIVLTVLLTCKAAAAGQKMSLVIGVDGLGSLGLKAAATPNIDGLIDGTFGGGDYRGAFSPHAFTGGVLGTPTQQISSSGPSWSSILTGVWVSKHGVYDNSFSGRNFTDNPTYFETFEENASGAYSASIINWTPIDTYVISSVDDGRSNMDFRSTPGGDSSVASVAAARIAGLDTDRPAAVFIHLDEVDGAGHSGGSYSQTYLSKIGVTDGYVGTLLRAVENRPDFANEDWQIIVIADHGHRPGGGHGGQSALERTIPLVVAGKSVAQGIIPTSPIQPSIVDVAPTVLEHLGLAVPGNIAGQPRGQTVLSHAAASLQDGLVSHLPLDGNADAGLAGSGCVEVGSVDYAVGKFGQAAGVTRYGDGYVRLKDDLGALFGNNTDFSISLWLRFDSFSSDPAFFSNKDWGSGQNTGINLALNPNNTLDFNTKAGSGSRSDLHPFAQLTPGAWQNVVFTVDRNGPTTLYIDGTLVGQIATSSQGSLDGSFDWVLLNDGTGSYGYSSTTSGLQIDEFAAWDRLLTLDEVSTLAVSAVPEPSALVLALVGLAGVGLFTAGRRRK